VTRNRAERSYAKICGTCHGTSLRTGAAVVPMENRNSRPFFADLPRLTADVPGGAAPGAGGLIRRRSWRSTAARRGAGACSGCRCWAMWLPAVQPRRSSGKAIFWTPGRAASWDEVRCAARRDGAGIAMRCPAADGRNARDLDAAGTTPSGCTYARSRPTGTAHAARCGGVKAMTFMAEQS